MTQKFRSNIIIITTPFLLTGLLVFFGYRLLTSQTPEARISIPQQSSQIEILTQDESERIMPTTPTPEKITALIQTVPNNRAQLAQTINTALDTKANTIYLSLPITLNPDHTLILTNVEASSEENISRWIKKTVNTAHQNGLHVILALTLNASEIISDPTAFTANYTQFSLKWAKLATEYGVNFFSGGITIGHPIYSKMTPIEVSQLLHSTQKNIRSSFSGQLGVGLCCQDKTTVVPQGYNFITIIPTDNVVVDTLQPIANQLAAKYKMTHTFIYQRDSQQVVQLTYHPSKP